MLNTCMFSRGAGTTADIESTKNENNGDKKASYGQRCKQDIQDYHQGCSQGGTDSTDFKYKVVNAISL